ncbi:MAG: redoxin domain-containing protein, partial [Clostridia bacterium]|nr:redoxin domain-containing protein [Clostridia bacterium]
MKKFLSVILVAMLCLGVAGLVACKGPASKPSTVEYKVTVAVEDGTLLSGVEVRFYSNSRLQAVAQTGADGVAKVELKAGEYVVDVRNFANTFELDTEKTYKVTESETEIEIKLLIKTNDISYKIEVQSFAGTPLNGIGVSVYQGAELLKQGKTIDGSVTFKLPSAIYDVKLTDIPVGYYEDEENAVYKTNYTGGLDLPGGETAIKLKTALIEDDIPADLVYGLGSVMYDFSIRLPSGSDFVLSEALEQYKAVYINFWATWCGPCVGEFPHIQKAYEQYSDDVYFLAVSISDANSAVNKFKQDNGYTFAMCADNGLSAHFDLSAGIPQTFVIDRYAVIAEYHFGSFADVYEVVNSFEKLSSDEYVPDPVLPPSEDEGEGEIELVKPTYTMPSSAEIQAAINGTGYTFGYYPEMDEYSWPWLIGEDADGKYIYTSNKLVSYSYAIVYSTITVSANQVIAFDYKVSTEGGADTFYVQIDGVLTMEASGLGQGWKTCYAFVADERVSGPQTHELSLTYLKDGGVSEGEDTVYVRNMRVIDVQTVAEEGASIDIRRYAAKGAVKNAEGEITSFKEYITPVYNEDDGY